MNQTEKRYVLNRIHEIMQKKLYNANQEITKGDNNVKLVLEKPEKLLRMAENAIDGSCYHRFSLSELVTKKSYTEYEKEDRRLDQEYRIKLTERQTAIEKECLRIKDQIVLGDADEALKMIAAFEAF